MSRAKVGFWLFRTKKANGDYHPRWRFRYLGADGRMQYGTGFSDKGETKRLAQQMALEADEIRRGVRKPTALADIESLRPIAEHVDAYQRWGRTQGGRGGRAWSKTHDHQQETNLKWWVTALGASALKDISLPAVEKALQEKAKDGVTGKTLSNLAGTLHGFVTWCLKRKYLASSPLDGLRDFDTSVTPKNFRRAFSLDEIGKLLAATPDPRRLLYRVALVTGFRASELKSLRVGDVDTAKKTVRLRADFAKDRRESIAAIPDDLAASLEQHMKGLAPESGVFPAFNPNDASNRIDKDMKAAGIEKRTFGGKADFHSLRVTHVNLGVELGFDVKTAQTLARHKTAEMTLNVYGRVNAERMRGAVESLDAAITSAENCSRNSRKEVKSEPVALASGGAIPPQVLVSQQDGGSPNKGARRDLNPRRLGPQPSALPG